MYTGLGQETLKKDDTKAPTSISIATTQYSSGLKAAVKNGNDNNDNSLLIIEPEK